MNVLALSISLTIGILLLIGGAIGNYVIINEYEDDKNPDLWRTYLSAVSIGIGFLMLLGISIASVTHVNTLQRKLIVEKTADKGAAQKALAEKEIAGAEGTSPGTET